MKVHSPVIVLLQGRCGETCQLVFWQLVLNAGTNVSMWMIRKPLHIGYYQIFSPHVFSDAQLKNIQMFKFVIFSLEHQQDQKRSVYTHSPIYGF